MLNNVNMGFIVAEIQKLQDELKNKTVEVSEGGGAFTVVMDGQQQVVAVKFGSGALQPKNAAALEMMAASAFNKALAESKDMLKNEINKLTGGMSLPNIPGIF